jgi:nicotinamidase-related amidase
VSPSSPAWFHPLVTPLPTEPVIVKRRVSAFYGTDLQVVLSGLGVKSLIVMGLSTSGAILSTVRWAADADYVMTVVEDGCMDTDETVHRVLMTSVLPRQAWVMTAEQVIEQLKRSGQ